VHYRKNKRRDERGNNKRFDLQTFVGGFAAESAVKLRKTKPRKNVSSLIPVAKRLAKNELIDLIVSGCESQISFNLNSAKPNGTSSAKTNCSAIQTITGIYKSENAWRVFSPMSESFKPPN